MDKSTACLVFSADDTGFAMNLSRLETIGQKGKPLN